MTGKEYKKTEALASVFLYLRAVNQDGKDASAPGKSG